MANLEKVFICREIDESDPGTMKFIDPIPREIKVDLPYDFGEFVVSSKIWGGKDEVFEIGLSLLRPDGSLIDDVSFEGRVLGGPSKVTYSNITVPALEFTDPGLHEIHIRLNGKVVSREVIAVNVSLTRASLN